MDANSRLESTEQSLLIIEKRTRLDIVIGVPHHAPAGVPTLPCPEHSDSDENTGFIGRHVAKYLDCCSIIACNSTIDPNKHLDSDYAMKIAQWSPKVLIEVHGHGKVRSRYDVEISCGSAGQTKYSEDMAILIGRKLSEDDDFADVSVCGHFFDLYFRATKTLTITDGRWIAYHIELSPRLRKPENGLKGRPTATAYKFADYLAAAMLEKHG